MTKISRRTNQQDAKRLWRKLAIHSFTYFEVDSSNGCDGTAVNRNKYVQSVILGGWTKTQIKFLKRKPFESLLRRIGFLIYDLYYY